MSGTVGSAATSAAKRAQGAGARLYAWWVLGTTLSGAIAWLLCAFIGMATFWAGLAMAGLIVGLAIGAAQEWVLRRRASISPLKMGSFGWAGVTSLGAQLGLTAPLTLALLLIDLVPPGLSGDVLQSSLFVGVALPAGGAILGALQAYLLRGQISGATWWIPANAIAWGGGGLLGLVVTDRLLTPMLESLAGSTESLAMFEVFTVGSVATAVYALVSGAVLVWFLAVPWRVGRAGDGSDS